MSDTGSLQMCGLTPNESITAQPTSEIIVNIATAACKSLPNIINSSNDNITALVANEGSVGVTYSRPSVIPQPADTSINITQHNNDIVSLPEPSPGQTDGSPSTTEDGQKANSKLSSVNWSKQAILRLISLHKDHEHNFNDPHYKKKSVWEMLSRKMKEEGFHYSWIQVENKWKSLTKKFRDTVDHNQKNGHVMTHTCPFYQELSIAYNYKPAVVAATASNSVGLAVGTPSVGIKRGADSFSGESFEDGDVSCLSKKKKYMSSPPPSATSTDLASLLRSINDDRKRQERIKMDRLEKMHKEKMDLFKSFLNVLRDMKK